MADLRLSRQEEFNTQYDTLIALAPVDRPVSIAAKAAVKVVSTGARGVGAVALIAKATAELPSEYQAAWKALSSNEKAGLIASAKERGVPLADVIPCLGRNSFDPSTLVRTDQGLKMISTLMPGERVLGYNEATGLDGYYPITAVHRNMDPALTYLWVKSNTTGAKEMITTTPEHPFYLAGNVDGSTRPVPVGHEDLSARWVGAGHLKDGDRLRMADGTQGTVVNVRTEQETREMFNLTVETAHTFYVGVNGWLVHNCGDADYPVVRKASPNDDNRAHVNRNGPGLDPVYSYPVSKYEADHIFPLNKFPELPGYSALTAQEKIEVANINENMMGLGKSTNASKQDKDWVTWQGHSKLGPINRDIRYQMMIEQERARQALINKINEILLRRR